MNERILTIRAYVCLLISVICIASIMATSTHAETRSHDKEPMTMIVEVEGDVTKHADYFRKHHPALEVVKTYSILFKGLALKGKPFQFNKIRSLDFVQAIHPTQNYSTLTSEKHQSLQTYLDETKHPEKAVLPNALNDTTYTGKGVKVAVVDTGIDYKHPDLAKNYQGGFDTVDLDEDPMETKADEGVPTLHGSHVAGTIAASGDLKGVAPDAELYGYRALGPGGSGTSVQVIAALEEAVKDGVDIINLSLGNDVNGPDYPTSRAVNKAIEKGVAVVIANGNAGPDQWTVGAPATSTKALAVGAATNPEKVFELEDTLEHNTFLLNNIPGLPDWSDEQGAYVTKFTQNARMKNKIVLLERKEADQLMQDIQIAIERGAKGMLLPEGDKHAEPIELEGFAEAVDIPMSTIAKEDYEVLRKTLKQKRDKLYVNLNQNIKPSTVAEFSSRGPVTTNWAIKPDVLAPGTNIVSTVPGGYEMLQGTSMATPHVAGVMALLKEAHPNWSIAQLFGALRTSAKQMHTETDEPVEPIAQGMGHVRPQAAIQTKAIIDNPMLSFGKINDHIKEKTETISIENMTSETQTYRFNVPKQAKGISWTLPLSFDLTPKEKKDITVGLKATTMLSKKGLHQGWLELERENDKQKIQLPYVWLNQTADYPHTAGLEFTLEPFTKDAYAYRFYATQDVERIRVDLYNPDTLVRTNHLMTVDDLKTGENKGTLKKSSLPANGEYIAIITSQLNDGTYETSATQVQIH